MSAEVGSSSAGWFDAELLFAETTAMATSAPTTTVARALPPIHSHLRRRARASEASASAAQSGVSEPEPQLGGLEPGPPGPH
jgi:hypothetical protein